MKKLANCIAVLVEFRRVFRDGCRLFKLAWKRRKRVMVFTGIVVFLSSIAPFAQNYAIGRLLNELVSLKGTGSLSNAAWELLAAGVLAGCVFAFANTMQFFQKSVLFRYLFADTSIQIHDRFANLDLQTHEDPAKKDLLATVIEKAMWHAPDFMQRMSYVFQNLLEVTMASVVFISADPIAGVIIFLTMFPRLMVELLYNHQVWNTEKSVAGVRRKFWYARWFISENQALTEAKLYQTVKFFVERVASHLNHIRDAEIGVERTNLKWQLLTTAISEAVGIWVIYRLVGQVVAGSMEVGTLTFYLGSMLTFRFALNSLSQNLGSQFKDGKFVSDMFEAFDLKPVVPVTSKSNTPVPETIDEIVFEDVWFAYPRTERYILKGFNLSIKGGVTLGLVAENGAGKTTLLKLLCRLYDPTRGIIRVNGIDIREFNLNKWQYKIGVMLQEYMHYEHLDVETAISLGRRNGALPDKAQIVKAAKLAGAHEFIERLKHGYETTLGRAFEDGEELSIGQYQKTAMARMFYRDAGLSIFDEPTSAMDGKAEAMIFDRILDGMKGRTKILITHRYFTLRRADQICVLEDGRVAEYGTHDELMKLGGIYAERYQAQASAYL